MDVSKSEQLTLLLTKQPSGMWAAVSLERCIIGGGLTLKDAAEDWARSLLAEILTDLSILNTPADQVLQRIQKAPTIYWEMYKDGARIQEAKDYIPIESIGKTLKAPSLTEYQCEPPPLAEARIG